MTPTDPSVSARTCCIAQERELAAHTEKEQTGETHKENALHVVAVAAMRSVAIAVCTIALSITVLVVTVTVGVFVRVRVASRSLDRLGRRCGSDGERVGMSVRVRVRVRTR